MGGANTPPFIKDMKKEEIEVCSEVLKTFDNFEFKGSVSEMIKHTRSLQIFAGLIDRSRKELGSPSKVSEELPKIEDKEEGN